MVELKGFMSPSPTSCTVYRGHFELVTVKDYLKPVETLYVVTLRDEEKTLTH